MDTNFSKVGGSQGYGDYYQEIDRRVEASKESESKYFDPVESSGTDLPFDRHDQVYTVFSLSTKGIPPKAINPLQPAFRIVGCFPTLTEAKEHAEHVSESNPSTSLFIDQCRNWIVAPDTIEHMTDAEHMTKVKEKLLSRYADERKNDNEEFEQARKGDEIERTLRKSTNDDVDDVPVTTQNSKSHIIRGRCDIQGQDLAVVVLLPNRDTGEFAFQVMGCFSKQEDADRWIRNVVSRKVVNYDIHVVSTCQWIFPNRMQGDGASDQQYRTPELQKIMTRQRAAPQEVKQFEDWLEENKTEETIRIAEEDVVPQ